MIFWNEEGEIEDYKLSTYIWEVKTKCNVPVNSIREGRKVVAYQVDVGFDSVSDVSSAPDVPAPAAEVVFAPAPQVTTAFYDGSLDDDAEDEDAFAVPSPS